MTAMDNFERFYYHNGQRRASMALFLDKGTGSVILATAFARKGDVYSKKVARQILDALVEYDGKKISSVDKVVCSKAKLVRRLTFSLKSLRDVVRKTNKKFSKADTIQIPYNKHDFLSIMREMFLRMKIKSRARDKVTAKKVALEFFINLGRLWKVDFVFKNQRAPKSYAKVYR